MAFQTQQQVVLPPPPPNIFPQIPDLSLTNCFHDISQPFLDRTSLKQILKRADQLRLADEIQRCYNAKDDIQHFFDVTLQLHEQAVTEITGIENQTLVRYILYTEVFTARSDYEHDPEMNEFFSSLIHVKFDKTKEGNLHVGDDLPHNISVVPLEDQTPLNFSSLVCHESPVVVIGGSWS